MVYGAFTWFSLYSIGFPVYKKAVTDKRIDRDETGEGVSGILYVVATPIGNLEDITLRALRILAEVSLIACEDTRQTRKLLTHFKINTPLTSYYRGREVSRAAQIITALKAGRDVALVSDAGVPCISDPGYILVREARLAGIRVVPVPGPSALTTAISMAGMEAEFFLFCGFLPSRSNERRKALRSLASESALLIFYESPHRLLKTLSDCLDSLGDRPAALCKELTKIYEHYQRGRLTEIIASLRDLPRIRGEYVLLIEGRADLPPRPESDDIIELLVWQRQAGSSLKDAVRSLAADLGLSRSKVYTEALRIWKESESA
ncbi:16S rRNA (cytidine(1402)-2'-O)-methyltransferase [Desulfobacterota bacterium M19]